MVQSETNNRRSSVHNGDILTATTDVIAHQVNCMGVMGAGLAKSIKESYPEVFHAYHEHCKCQEELLGTCQLVQTSGGRYVANLFGQKSFGRKNQQTDYHAVHQALLDCVQQMQDKGLKSIAIPYKMGCGLGGGAWPIVKNIITEVFAPTDMFVEIWKL